MKTAKAMASGWRTRVQLLVLIHIGWAAHLSTAHAEIPEAWLGRRVDAVELAGEARGRIRPREVGIPVGVPLSRGLLRSTVVRLSRTGLYRDVQIDGHESSRGITLTVRLTPRVVAVRVDVNDKLALERREILRVLDLKADAEVNRERLPELAQRLRERFALRGYRETTVRILLRATDDPTRKVVRVAIDQGEPTRILAYQFEGDPVPERKGLRRAIHMEHGEVLDIERVRSTLEDLQKRLREAGYYESRFGAVEPRMQKGGGAVVRVKSHIGPHYQVQIFEPWPLTRGEVLETLRLPEQPLEPKSTFSTLESRIVEQYHLRGYVGATVEMQVIPPPEPGKDAELRVFVKASEQLDVVGVRFLGAKHFSEDFLRGQLFSYLGEDLPSSVISQPVDSELADRLGFGGQQRRRRREQRPPPLSDPRRLYYRSTYEEALDHIRDLYRGAGYLSVDLSEVELVPLPDEENEAEARIQVREGPRAFIYDVRVDNNVQITTYELLAAADLQPGQPFSYLELEEARLRALEAYRERGFFYATVEPAVRLSDDGTRAEVVFEIVERFVVRVGAIEVRGAEISNEHMVLNRLTLHPGEVYRPSEARLSEEQLLSLDVFTSVSIAPEEADLPARVKTLVVSLNERRTQYLGWNGGFSSGEGVRGGMEYGYRNLFGSAVHVTLRGQLGYQVVFLDEEIKENYESLEPDQRIEYQANAGISTPYIPNAPRVGASLDLVVLQDLQRDFRMQKEGLVGSLYYRPTKKWVITLAEELEETFFQLFKQDTANFGNLAVTELVPDGRNTLLSTHLSTGLDLRDNAFSPRKGAMFHFSSQWARTLRDDRRTVTGDDGQTMIVFKSNMLRFAATTAFYVPLGPKLVFASQIRGGVVVHLRKASDSYPNRRFYLGGINFRGFRQNAMVPQDLEDAGKDSQSIVSRGGEVFVAAQNELRFPLFGQVYGGLFSDIGNLWSDPREVDLRELEVTVGAGIRLQTPVASLAFDYGVRKIRSNPFDIVGALQFAFQRF